MDNTNSVPARIYVPRWMGIAILVGFVLLAIGVGVALYRTYGRQNLYDPKKETESLGSLGAPKVSPGATTEQIAEAVTDHMNKDTQGKLTLIFFYDGFNTQKQAVDAVNVFKEVLKDVKPFSDVEDLLAYKIFTTDGKKCHAENDTLVCDPKLIESFKKLGVDHFKVILLSPDEFNSGAPLSRGSNSFISLSTFNSNMSIQDHNRWMGILFTQLLGRSLGIHSEYTDIKKMKTPVPPPDGVTVKKLKSSQPNCAPDMQTAEKWWGNYAKIFPEVSYNKGCEENPAGYYPEKNTLASDFPQKEGYGIVSEDYLRGVLYCFYGDKESILPTTGKYASVSASIKSCDTFKKDFPNFWKE